MNKYRPGGCRANCRLSIRHIHRTRERTYIFETIGYPRTASKQLLPTLESQTDRQFPLATALSSSNQTPPRWVTFRVFSSCSSPFSVSCLRRGVNKRSPVRTGGLVASGSIANESISVPPVGVYMVAGCGADLFINICLTVLAYVYIEDVGSFARPCRSAVLEKGQLGIPPIVANGVLETGGNSTTTTTTTALGQAFSAGRQRVTSSIRVGSQPASCFPDGNACL